MSSLNWFDDDQVQKAAAQAQAQKHALDANAVLNSGINQQLFDPNNEKDPEKEAQLRAASILAGLA